MKLKIGTFAHASIVRILALGAMLVPTSSAFSESGVYNPDHSVARMWNELLLESIRNDFARPPIHARNLFHVSIGMWDSWAMYDQYANGYLVTEKAIGVLDVEAARNETISFASYRILQARFAKSPGAGEMLTRYDCLMDELGYDKDFTSTVGSSPAARGNRVAITILFKGLNDNSNEAGGYENQYYEPLNDPLVVPLPGNPDLIDPNRWQPLALDFFVDQSGNVIIGGYPDAIGHEWGQVESFSLNTDDVTVYNRDGFDYWVYFDPGPPAQFGEEYYKWGNEMVTIWSSHLDPADGVLWDISPGAMGNAQIPDPIDYFNDPVGTVSAYCDLLEGGDIGTGRALNPVTGLPYEPQIVPRGDYARILAEFWADGPDSETPPGHWFTILNYVSDHPDFEKRIAGEGNVVNDLEWDVKAYLAMGGCQHDTAIVAWGCKGWYDYIRPVSVLRHLCDLGQCTDPGLDSYDPDGINLRDGLIELVTPETTAPGQRHEHLVGSEGKIAFYTWRGPDYIPDEATTTAGVGWILAENWWPYQRPSFVTPPFAGYVSGHSTYSRSAARLMTNLTGTEFFPGGMGEFECQQNEFLVFEDGPSIDVTLQWATYFDASDQCSLSRIWGGIHAPIDDLPGRYMGEQTAASSWALAVELYGEEPPCPADLNQDGIVDGVDLGIVFGNWGECGVDCIADFNFDGLVDGVDLAFMLSNWGSC